MTDKPQYFRPAPDEDNAIECPHCNNITLVKNEDSEMWTCTHCNAEVQF